MTREVPPHPYHRLGRVVESVLKTLTSEEEEVMRFTLGLDGELVSLEDIQRETGLSLDEIHRLQATAFRKLQHPSRNIWKILEQFHEEGK